MSVFTVYGLRHLPYSFFEKFRPIEGRFEVIMVAVYNTLSCRKGSTLRIRREFGCDWR